MGWTAGMERADDESVGKETVSTLPYAVVTQVVPEIYVASLYQKNTETKGNLMQLQVPFTILTNFKQAKSEQPDWYFNA